MLPVVHRETDPPTTSPAWAIQICVGFVQLPEIVPSATTATTLHRSTHLVRKSTIDFCVLILRFPIGFLFIYEVELQTRQQKVPNMEIPPPTMIISFYKLTTNGINQSPHLVNISQKTANYEHHSKP